MGELSRRVEDTTGQTLPRPSACAWIGAPTATRSRVRERDAVGAGRWRRTRSSRSEDRVRRRGRVPGPASAAPTRARGASAASPPARRPARSAGPAATPGGVLMAVWVIAPSHLMRQGGSSDCATGVFPRGGGGECHALAHAWIHRAGRIDRKRPAHASRLSAAGWGTIGVECGPPRPVLEVSVAFSGVRGEEAVAAQGRDEGQGSRVESGAGGAGMTVTAAMFRLGRKSRRGGVWMDSCADQRATTTIRRLGTVRSLSEVRNP